ncbi:hypothetical protein JGU66_22730 [Myxococcaceae bacterium JPH2]|nr:hypothetical protein [Myxococcaceae bacterium JPH2]
MSRNVLWAYGHFSDNAPRSIMADVQNIGTTAFDVVVLPFLHVQPDGALHLNDTPVSQLWSGLPDALRQLKTGFPIRRKLLVSLGPFQADFTAAARDLKGFAERLAEFLATYHLDGLDLDFEGDFSDPANVDRIAGIVNACHEMAARPLITLSPFKDTAFWAGRRGVLSRTTTRTGNKVSWLHVQLYAGEYNTAPSGWATRFHAWARAIADGPNRIAEADAPAFLVPGCNAETYSPQQLATAIAAVREQHPSMGGAFVWNYDAFVARASVWATTIRGAFSA